MTEQSRARRELMEGLTFPEVDTSDLADLRRRVEADSRGVPVGSQEEPTTGHLTENDHEPGVGARVIDAWECVWERHPEGYWLPVSSHHEEPASWVQLAGNYGPVTPVTEPVKCHGCGQMMAERLFISGLCVGCERARNKALASEYNDG